jgi:hypothetical protein
MQVDPCMRYCLSTAVPCGSVILKMALCRGLSDRAAADSAGSAFLRVSLFIRRVTALGGQAREGIMAKRLRRRLSWSDAEQLVPLLASAADLAARLIDVLTRIH